MQSHFIAFARAIVLSAIMTVTGALPGQTDELIDPFDRSEKRIIQAALAREGHYDGTLDGDWGPRSARAFQSYLVRQQMGFDAREQTLRRLMNTYRAAYRDEGWAWIEPESGVGRFLAPKALFQDAGPEDGEVLLMVSSDGTMRITRAVGTRESATNIHRSWLEQHAGPDPAFALDRRDLIISSVTLGNSDRVYVRTDRNGDAYETVWFRAAPKDAGRLMLMASSVSNQPDISVAPPADGRLAALMGPDIPNRNPRPQVELTPVLVAPPASADPTPLFVNGVYINSSDLLTTASMLDRCDRPVLPDGSALFPIAVSEKYDLAVLRGTTVQSVWLPLATKEETTLGTIVRAIGRDYELTEFMLQTIGEISAVSAGALSIGDENVLALAAPPTGYFAITSTIPEGSLGWPILTESGALSGVVLLQPEAQKTAKRISFAVSVGWLREFLEKRNVIFTSEEDGGPVMGGQVPATVSNAIVGLSCAP